MIPIASWTAVECHRVITVPPTSRLLSVFSRRRGTRHTIGPLVDTHSPVQAAPFQGSRNRGLWKERTLGAWRWRVGILVTAMIGLALIARISRTDFTTLDDEGLMEDFGAFARARNDLI